MAKTDKPPATDKVPKRRGPHGGLRAPRNLPRPHLPGEATMSELVSPTYAAAERVAFAQKWLFRKPGKEITDMIIAQYGVSRAVAYRDVLDARELVIADSVVERPFVRAWATAQFRTIAADARTDKQYAAAAACIREIAKLHGAYEPDRITIVPSESIELGAIIGVLDEAGQAALDVLLSQIERAKLEGRLATESGSEPRPAPAPPSDALSAALALGDGSGN